MRNSPPKRVKKVLDLLSEQYQEPEQDKIINLSATKNFDREYYGRAIRAAYADQTGRNFLEETCNKIITDKKETRGKFEMENEEFVSIYWDSLLISI